MRKWISVEDRLPENFDEMLVTDEDSYTVAYYTVDGWVAATDMLDATNYDGGCIVKLDTDVTHWMPLPAPPEGSHG